MAPFESPKVVVSGFKDKIESLTTVQGDRLYIGTASGNLCIYGLDDNAEDGEEAVSLVEIKKGLARRAIEQIGFIKDINSLVILSESTVTLYPLPTFSPATPLLKAKAAFSFAIHSSIQHIDREPTEGFVKATSIPTIVTQLLVGCRRKVVIYCWKDGEAQETKEAPLPHSARIISFLDKDTACFAYSPTEHAVFSIPTMTATDVSIPLPLAATGTGIGAFSGLGSGLTGYMTLGLGAKPKPAVVHISESEALMLKDNEGIFIGPEATPSRPASIEWPAPPEEIAFVKPYIFAVLPPGSVPAQTSKPATDPSTAGPQISTPTTVVQIRSSISLLPTQTLSFPFNSPSSSSSTLAHPPTTNSTVRLLTPSPSAKSPLFLVTTPTDKAVATAEGSTIWEFRMKPWAAQIDELVVAGQYSDALALLDTIDVSALADKEQRATRIRALNAVSQFRSSQFDVAIDTLISLDINPAKVVALYPEAVAGRLSVPQDSWIPLFGGPVHTAVDDESTSSTPSLADPQRDGADAPHHEKAATETADHPITSGTGTIRGRFKTGLGAFLPSVHKDGDRASISPKRKPKQTVHDDLPRSVETLLRYLSDRRPKVAAALAAVGITPAHLSHEIAPLSETSVEDLFALPNAPLSSLTPEQLLRFAQIVDTALLNSYLLIRPGLLGSLCRVPNWCEVSEVEEELRARKKYADLRDLYNGKKMHKKALELLKELSEQETDMEDKLEPSIYYLQKLGSEHLDEIFASSRWIFERDSTMAFQIFTSEDVELPRSAVADFLDGIDPLLCIRYLEFLIEERREESTIFHDRLAELYLKLTLSAKRKGEKDWPQHYSKLLKFIDTTDRYSIDRLYRAISSEDLFEARAILLGRFGRHDQALELYVYRLHDYLKAEEHCRRVYRAGTETSAVYLTLLRIYLQPTVKPTTDLLQPALELVARHSSQLDAVDTLQLLPPLVTTKDIRTFLIGALRTPVFDTRVIRNLSKARGDQVERNLMALQAKRVKVTDSRICPHCHKRIGNSFIAVHAPRGEVTHYQCREAFSRRLNETRH